MAHVAATYDALPQELRDAFPLDGIWDAAARRPSSKVRLRFAVTGDARIAIMYTDRSAPIRFKVTDPRVGCVLYAVTRHVCSAHPAAAAAEVKWRVMRRITEALPPPSVGDDEATFLRRDLDPASELWDRFYSASNAYHRSADQLYAAVLRRDPRPGPWALALPF